MPGDWDFNAALDRAEERIATLTGTPLDQVRAYVEPAGGASRARKTFDVAAPAYARLYLALTLGTPPEELDRVRGGARLLLEGAKQALAIVGLRAGEELTVDMSDRMRGFMERWQSTRELPGGDDLRVIETTALSSEPVGEQP